MTGAERGLLEEEGVELMFGSWGKKEATARCGSSVSRPAREAIASSFQKPSAAAVTEKMANRSDADNGKGSCRAYQHT